MLFEVKAIDHEFYDDHLASFLPEKMVDVHTHVWLKSFLRDDDEHNRGAKWPSRVAEDNSIEDLLETYRLMFPRQRVTPLVFGYPASNVILDQTNDYVTRVAAEHRLPSLILNDPSWSAEELERRVRAGGFLGLKPYLCFAPSHLGPNDITIFDFLPRHQLEVANDHGWIVVLHVPRNARLKDPVNLDQMLEIERRYPEVRMVYAHVGRAYCAEDVGNAFEVLGDTEHMRFDFCANTNAQVIEQVIRVMGPKRVLFGSDLPILRMRMRRICENGMYINLVPPGLYGDISDDPHMREVSPEEGARLSFFMYEELLAFRTAAEALGLSIKDVEDICYNNAVALFAEQGWTL
ncbi:MAG: amidohydrolase family protein [Chloroflexi bacterium]|nr:amidohydrolase family protein [Chloroflexota bacterium]